MPPIKNTRILIIGGSSGIGLGVADKCLEEGATVHIASSNSSRVQETTTSLAQKHPGAKISGHVCDLSGDDVEERLAALLEAVKPLDHVVFTAGDRLAIQPLENVTLDSIRRAGHIRFVVPLLLAKLAPRYMSPGFKSSITLTTGAIADKPMPGWSLVNGYMTGMHGMTKNLALDLKPLRVNIVSPGAVRTPLWGSDEAAEAAGAKSLTGKVGTVEEVAEAYVYLMKDSNATGSCVSTNSGTPLL
ncbi:short-chain dehydrogenase [Aspergillus egyptiacus]|nr:short-chain dehydrogenase [Aspergillus egyptiacus]